jgi:hypothetical protein
MTLTTWLNDLRQRHCELTIQHGVINTVGRAANWNDHLVIRRLHAALQTAAAGTHPDWWNWASGRDRTTVPDDLPWTCATCGTPDTPHLDADLLAWCDLHWQPDGGQDRRVA